MILSGGKPLKVEHAVLGLLVVAVAASLLLTLKAAGKADRSGRDGVQIKNAESMDFQTLDKILQLASRPVPALPEEQDLFVGELRVVAIGSAYPIPYEAEVCPFSGVPQPAMNQLDRDGDQITDDWELKYGFNKYDASDALLDLDEDGFTNLEEFKSGSNPGNAEEHPPYATKLRFVERKDIPFFLVFQGFTELQDGTVVFQLNAPEIGKSHFASIGESVEGVELQRFEPAENGRPATLYVMRGSTEIKLIRGAVALDPESKAELINILDRTPIIVTMGALLSLHNDEYTVLDVLPDKVILRDMRTGTVFDIVGLADGKR